MFGTARYYQGGDRVLVKSPAMALFLEPLKAAAAEGAIVELKLRLLAGKVPALQKYAHQKKLEDIEDELAFKRAGAIVDRLAGV
jgi:hypothetical protein